MRYRALCAAAVLAMAVTAAVTPGAAADPVDTYDATSAVEPALSSAFAAAARQARAAGVDLVIVSGRRSWAEQQQLWVDGLARYGSPERARQWVLPPAESSHVSGAALDVGPWQGAAWLAANGNTWGLCRTFANEWWHFELATEPGGSCPPMVADASRR